MQWKDLNAFVQCVWRLVTDLSDNTDIVNKSIVSFLQNPMIQRDIGEEDHQLNILRFIKRLHVHKVT